MVSNKQIVEADFESAHLFIHKFFLVSLSYHKAGKRLTRSLVTADQRQTIVCS